MKNAVFENNQYKLDAETCLVETVKLKKPFRNWKNHDINQRRVKHEIKEKNQIQLSISTQLLIIAAQLFYSPTRS